jgi:hypothetical protein
VSAIVTSKLRFFLILIRLIVLIFLSSVMAVLLYVLSLNPFPDLHIALKIFFMLIIVLTVWSTFWQWIYIRYAFYKIKLEEDGITFINYLVFGHTKFYKWSDLSGYKTDSYSLSYSSFDLVKLYVRKRCVFVLDEANVSNFEELKRFIDLKLEEL